MIQTQQHTLSPKISMKLIFPNEVHTIYIRFHFTKFLLKSLADNMEILKNAGIDFNFVQRRMISKKSSAKSNERG